MTTVTPRELPRHWQAIRQDWPVLTLYQRFETSIAYLLSVVVGAVILVAFARLGISVVDTLVLRSLNPLDHSVFQQVFGQILTTPVPIDVMAEMDVRSGADWYPVLFETRQPVDVDGFVLHMPTVREQIAVARLFGRSKDLQRAERLETLIR